MALNKEIVEAIIEGIKVEDELPSSAGEMFRDIINEQFSGKLGMREITIIAGLLRQYSKLPFSDQNEIADKLNDI